MKWLLLGSHGMLGSVFASGEVKFPFLVDCVDIEDVDITQQASVEKIFSDLNPQGIINCTAYTNVDGAESDQKTCRNVNVNGVKNIAQACKKRNAFLVHYSTDFIFDGKKKSPYDETDSPTPLNYYGLSKLEGEHAIRTTLSPDQYLIIRTSWLFGQRGQNFIRKILTLAEQKPKLQIVTDQNGSPTYTRHLAQATVQLIKESGSGIFNITNKGTCSWFDLARFALDCAGLREYPLEKTTSAQFKCPASRPANSVLNLDKFHTFCSYTMPFWQDAVKEYVRELINSK